MKYKYQLPETERIEVVLRKEMSYRQYKKLIPKALKKRWKIQGYQLGIYSPGCKAKIEIDEME